MAKFLKSSIDVESVVDGKNSGVVANLNYIGIEVMTGHMREFGGMLVVDDFFEFGGRNAWNVAMFFVLVVLIKNRN